MMGGYQSVEDEEVEIIVESSLLRSLAGREEGGSGSGTLGAKRRFLWNGIDCMGQLENRQK